jgi:hypothetical protein
MRAGRSASLYAAGATELTIELAEGESGMNSLNIMKFGYRFVAAVVAFLLTAIPLFGQASVGGLAGNLSGIAENLIESFRLK